MAEIVIMPKLGFDMAEGTLVKWIVAENQVVEKGQVLAEIETDKATVEVESTYSGVVRSHLVKEGEIVPVNTPIAIIGEKDEQIDIVSLLGRAGVSREAKEAVKARKVEEEAAPSAITVEPEREEEEGRLPGGVRASPLARRMAEERGIDLKMIKGSGPGGRILKSDIEAFEALPVAVELPHVAMPVALGEVPPDRRLPLSRLRAAIGRRMVQSKQQAPQFYVTHQYDVDALVALRTQVNALLPDDQKTSLNDYIVKAVALTLREFPNLNAALDESHQEVVHFGHIHIGVAVAVENGLLTVVCRDADLKSVRQISQELRAMVARAREGKVRQDDIEGSTFSVSNLGMFDVEQFTAIINPPEAAILAVGSVLEVLVVQDGQLRAGKRMKATITVDHRVSDGAEAARFMQALAKYIENPLWLMI